MASPAAVPISRPSVLRAILLGGLLAGVLDAAYAVLYFGLTRGVPAQRIFQHIAGGLLGAQAFSLGWKSVTLGLVIHFLVATGAATVYCLTSLRIPALVRKPLLWGPVFGLAVYVFMNYVVLPLSAVAPPRAPRPADIYVTGILVHMFLIGLPIALIARARARAPRQLAVKP